MVKFAKRSSHLPGIGILFHGSKPFPLEESTKITLHHEDDPNNSTIIIKDLLRKADGRFTGTVFGIRTTSNEARRPGH